MSKQQFLNMHYYNFIECLNWKADVPAKVTIEYFCNAIMLEAAYIATYQYNQIAQVKSIS